MGEAFGEVWRAPALRGFPLSGEAIVLHHADIAVAAARGAVAHAVAAVPRQPATTRPLGADDLARVI